MKIVMSLRAIIVYQHALQPILCQRGTGENFCCGTRSIMPNWRDFNAKMKANRKDKGKGKKNDTAENETLIVQRLSTEVSGKAQKY